ncbi:MAG: prepilin peptidase [Candidatus Aminicenantia bacterium]
MVELLIILFGLAWGSFLNVVIYRLPRKLSLIKPGSFCPSCHHKIPFYNNIPLLSYLILKGKCRFCGRKIAFSYPLVEFLTPLSFLILYQKFSFNYFFIASVLFTSALIVLAFIDYYHQILPNEITLPGFALFISYSFVHPFLNFGQALLGVILGAGFLLVIYWSYYSIRKIEGLGLGDVKMMLMVGAFLGWLKTFFTLILGSFVAAIVGLFLIFLKKKDLKYSLPFGTFLAPAAFVSLVWGGKIISAYLSLFRKP